MKKILLFVGLLSAACWAQDSAKKPIIKTDVSSTAPRYQLFSNLNVRADTFLLDTATGKIWQMTTYTDMRGDPTVWVLTTHIDSDADLTEFLRTHMSKADARAAGIQ